MRQTVGLELTKPLDHVQQQDEAIGLLVEEFDKLVADNRFSWFSNVRFIKQLGCGGQGSVFLAERCGADGFQVPVAVKFYSPDRYSCLEEYDNDMVRVAEVATKVSQIRHHNLLGINHFLNRDRVRVMVMEWVQGIDLRRLLTARYYGVVKERVSRKMWDVYNNQLVTAGPVQPRLRAEVTLSILKDLVNSLVALHDEGIIHSDIKPSNIMLTRNGSSKLIDIGSSVRQGEKSWRHGCTPAYAAVDVLEGAAPSVESDLVSLGYLALELLTGKPLFPEIEDLDSLIEAKRKMELEFVDQLPDDLDDGQGVTDVLACLLRAQRFVAPAGVSTSELIQEMLTEVSQDNSSSMIKVWIEELWELEESSLLAAENPTGSP